MLMCVGSEWSRHGRVVDAAAVVVALVVVVVVVCAAGPGIASCCVEKIVSGGHDSAQPVICA